MGEWDFLARITELENKLATRDARIAELEAAIGDGPRRLLEQVHNAKAREEQFRLRALEAEAALTASEAGAAAMREAAAAYIAQRHHASTCRQGSCVCGLVALIAALDSSTAGAPLLQRLEQTERERGWALEVLAVVRKGVFPCSELNCGRLATRRSTSKYDNERYCDVHGPTDDVMRDTPIAPAIRALGPLLGGGE